MLKENTGPYIPSLVARFFSGSSTYLHGIYGHRFALQRNFGIITNAHTVFICVNYQNIIYIALDESTTKESWPIKLMEFIVRIIVQNECSQRVADDTAKVEINSKYKRGLMA